MKLFLRRAEAQDFLTENALIYTCGEPLRQPRAHNNFLALRVNSEGIRYLKSVTISLSV